MDINELNTLVVKIPQPWLRGWLHTAWVNDWSIDEERIQLAATRFRREIEELLRRL